MNTTDTVCFLVYALALATGVWLTVGLIRNGTGMAARDDRMPSFADAIYRNSGRPSEDKPRALTKAEMLKAAGAIPFASVKECPKCKTPARGDYDGKAIDGPFFGGFCRGTWRCRLRTEHFHMGCKRCGGTWLAAPADVELS